MDEFQKILNKYPNLVELQKNDFLQISSKGDNYADLYIGHRDKITDLFSILFIDKEAGKIFVNTLDNLISRFFNEPLNTENMLEYFPPNNRSKEFLSFLNDGPRKNSAIVSLHEAHLSLSILCDYHPGWGMRDYHPEWGTHASIGVDSHASAKVKGYGENCLLFNQRQVTTPKIVGPIDFWGNKLYLCDKRFAAENNNGHGLGKIGVRILTHLGKNNLISRLMRTIPDLNIRYEISPPNIKFHSAVSVPITEKQAVYNILDNLIEGQFVKKYSSINIKGTENCALFAINRLRNVGVDIDKYFYPKKRSWDSLLVKTYPDRLEQKINNEIGDGDMVAAVNYETSTVKFYHKDQAIYINVSGERTKNRPDISVIEAAKPAKSGDKEAKGAHQHSPSSAHLKQLIEFLGKNGINIINNRLHSNDTELGPQAATSRSFINKIENYTHEITI